MDTKFRNSTCSGKYTDRNFQKDHLEEIWGTGRLPKSASKRCYAQGKWRDTQDGKLPFLPKNSIFRLVFSQFDFFLSHGKNNDVN